MPGARDEDTVQDFSDALLDICAARNNNAELKAEAKLNRAGYFDDLKHALPQGISDNVQWRTNDTGRLKVGDVIAMAWIPLSCIDLPKDADGKQIEAPTPTSLYSGKAKLLDRFEDVMSSPEVTKPSTESINERTEEVVLYNEKVRSALNLTRDFIDIFERINAELPDLYNKSGGKFGGIDAVDKANKKNPRTGKTPQKYSKFYRQPSATRFRTGSSTRSCTPLPHCSSETRTARSTGEPTGTISSTTTWGRWSRITAKPP